jgi:hypothetical protein
MPSLQLKVIRLPRLVMLNRPRVGRVTRTVKVQVLVL